MNVGQNHIYMLHCIEYKFYQNMFRRFRQVDNVCNDLESHDCLAYNNMVETNTHDPRSIHSQLMNEKIILFWDDWSLKEKKYMCNQRKKNGSRSQMGD